MKRPPIIRTWSDAIIADNFAGGGGASSGIEEALGRSPDIAINHDPEAIAMHRANHPETTHYLENVWKVDPVEACAGRPVALAWFSPTCTHFSKAKGTALDESSIRIRGLAWVAVRWAAAVKPRVICLENVEEFAKWGPLHRDHTDRCRGRRKCRKSCRIHRPIKEREGSLFRSFVSRLEKHGYRVEWRLLRACDFGAPTTRRRLFLVARCDGRPIVWPSPTHGPGRATPYRTAAEVIDWSIPCPSIFERERPLAEKTLARIARGIQKFVVDNPRPFIVPVAYGDKGGRDVRVGDVDQPLRTICGARGGHAIAVPYLVHRSNGERGAKVKADGSVAPGQAPRIYDVQQPLGTIVAQGQKHAAAVAILIKNNGGNNDRAGCSMAAELTRPIDTIACRDQKSLTVAHLVRYNSENSPGSARGQDVRDPLTTLDTANRHGLVAASLIKMRGTSSAHINASPVDLGDPLPTISAGTNSAGGGGCHIAAVAAFLVRYNGESGPQSVDAPIGTIDTTDRFGLVAVTIDGEEYVIADIGMRMLTPRELYRAQGFPENYRIDFDFEGKPLTKTAQIRMVGNSVCPPIAAAVARACLEAA